MYNIIYDDGAVDDFKYHEKSGNKPLLRKLVALIEELRLNPRAGTGKPEPLKHDRAGQWSRRINNEHRLIYTIEDNVVKIVCVLSAKGHY